MTTLSNTSKIGWATLAAGAAIMLCTSGNMRITGLVVTTLGAAAMAYGVQDVKNNSDRLAHYEKWIDKTLHHKNSLFFPREIVSRVAYASLMLYGTGLAAGYEVVRTLSLWGSLILGGNKSLKLIENLAFPTTFSIAYRGWIKTLYPQIPLSQLSTLHYFDINDTYSDPQRYYMIYVDLSLKSATNQEVWKARGYAICELCIVIIATVTSILAACTAIVLGSTVRLDNSYNEKSWIEIAEEETYWATSFPFMGLPFALMGIIAPVTRAKIMNN